MIRTVTVEKSQLLTALLMFTYYENYGTVFLELCHRVTSLVVRGVIGVLNIY